MAEATSPGEPNRPSGTFIPSFDRTQIGHARIPEEDIELTEDSRDGAGKLFLSLGVTRI